MAPPVNDNIADAVNLAPGVNNFSVTTVDATAEQTPVGLEEDLFWGYFDTVWYEGVVGSDGNIVVSVTNANYGYYAEIYRFTGTPTDPDDLFDNGTFLESVDDSGGMDDASVTEPVLQGQHIYILVTSYSFIEDDEGTLDMQVTMPPLLECLDAQDYIFDASPSSSVVSGAVRETQRHDNSIAGVSGNPYESLFADQNVTLRIPGSDICGDSPGFYAVLIKGKNGIGLAGTSYYGGFIRNGQPILPGAWLTGTTGSTPVSSWMTIAPTVDQTFETPDQNDNTGFAQSLTMVRYLPVHPDDVIDVVITGVSSATFAAFQIDITQICFARMLDATTFPPYSVLDIPDFPLGTVIGDMNTADQAGDLCPYKATGDTYYNHTIEGMDICVTDDGTVWVVANIEAHLTAGGDRYIGPILQKWTGSSWTIVRDDIEGLGVKRNFRDGAGAAGATGPFGISMDTDGTDIWIVYGVDNGAGPAASGVPRNQALRVKKYEPGSDTLSSVGGLVWNTMTTRVYQQSDAGGFPSTAQIKLSPAGVPWLAFYDIADESAFFADRPGYTAKWNGSVWTVYQLPPPPNFVPGTWWEAEVTEAESIITGSPTVSSVSEDGETAVRDTQTAYTNDTISFIPPAGKWDYSVRYQYNRPSGTGGIKIKAYKNGVQWQSAVADDFTASSATDPTWQWQPSVRAYQEFNGTSDVLTVRIARTGTATEVFIDKIQLVPWERIIGSTMWDVLFVDNQQYHVMIAFPDGEDPVAIQQTWSPIITEDTGSPFYVGPGTVASLVSFSWNRYHYARWSGSVWETVWDELIEDMVPELVSEKTMSEPYGAAERIRGHWQQGMMLYSDGTDVYVAACLGIGSSASEFVVAKATDAGLVALPTASAPAGPAGIIGGAGLESISYGYGQWGGLAGCYGKGMIMTPNGLFVGFIQQGLTTSFEETIVTPSPNGIGDWFLAADQNNPIGQNSIDIGSPALVMSPDGDTVYILAETFIWSDQDSGTPSPTTFGVWECPVLVDEHIPLVPFGGEINMNLRTSRRMDVVRLNQ